MDNVFYYPEWGGKFRAVTIEPPIKKRKRKQYFYKDIVCAFDIETSRVPGTDDSVMYIWQFQIDTQCTVYGRTWEQFKDFIEYLESCLDLQEAIVVYVHNLSFEFQFLSGIFNFTEDSVFCVDSRKILRATLHNHIEFRDSYLHSNMSLSKFLENMQVEDQKLKDFDYSKKRYWFTELSEHELLYCVNDVRGLVQAIKTEMEKDGDTLYTIPLTSTGYVRRDFRNALQYRMEDIKKLLPDYELYKLLREAFRGGNVHANRFYAGQVLDNVKSMDRSSSYPETQVNLEFPISPFRKSVEQTWERFVDLVSRHRAVVARISLSNVKLRLYEWGCPYIPVDKCRNIINAKEDNGRILYADYLEISVTDIDFKIIENEYEWTVQGIKDIYYAKYGKLPREAIKLINKLYTDKTELKDVEGQEYFYLKSKNKINSVYGMTAQDPLKDNVVYCNGNYEKAEREHWALKSAFLPYQWGVWCTAHARKELEYCIREAHKQATFIYCDTDSVKYIGNINLDEYNKTKIELAEYNGGKATDKHGVAHYMGVYEQERTADRFVTWGAKKYACQYGDDIKITIAGVPKKQGAEELKLAGGLDRLQPSYTFYAGKLASYYNDTADYHIVIDDHDVHVTKNVTLKDTQYILSIADKYYDILQDAVNYRKAMDLMHVNKRHS